MIRPTNFTRCGGVRFVTCCPVMNAHARLTVVVAAAAALACGGFFASAQNADQSSGKVAPLETMDMSLAQAQAAVDAAVAACEDNDLKMNIAVVDAGGNLKAFARMDGAWLGSIDIAIKKAKTARYFDMPTGNIGELSQPGQPLYMIEASNDGLITFPGGIPIKAADGTVVGAIGVSGSTVENDHMIAEAGLEKLK